jgi:Protein of unknown function (DUF4058)
MPLHDWTRVHPEIHHDFHVTWVGQIHNALNEGLLPQDHYALIEQHADRPIKELLMLPIGVVSPSAPRRRTVAIRHISGHRLVALLEIVSPANKDRARHVEEFANKAVNALGAGVHLLLVDLFPPGAHDPFGMYGAVCQTLGQSDGPYDVPADEPLAIAAFAAGPRVEVYLEHIAVGAALPEMPLFLHPERYINAPLEATYQAAWHGMPAFWRVVLEGRTP